MLVRDDQAGKKAFSGAPMKDVVGFDFKVLDFEVEEAERVVSDEFEFLSIGGKGFLRAGYFGYKGVTTDRGGIGFVTRDIVVDFYLEGGGVECETHLKINEKVEGKNEFFQNLKAKKVENRCLGGSESRILHFFPIFFDFFCFSDFFDRLWIRMSLFLRPS